MPSNFSRRDLLTCFLGLPIALSACSSRQAKPRFGGEIVGPSNDFGHRLRDGFRPVPSEDRWYRVRVVIVGGGIAGLAAAWQFLRLGFDDFILLELEPAPGGTSRSGSSSLVPYPWGAHYIPAPTAENQLLVTLLDEMGVLEGRDAEGKPTVGEQFLCRDPQERIFHLGRWYEGLYLHAGESVDDQAQHKRFHEEVDRWVGWRDGKGRRAFAIPTALGSDDAEVTALDKMTMADWLVQRGFTSSRLRWLVSYACRDDYGTPLEATSAWAGLFYFASRVRKPGAEPQPLITWPEGNGRLVKHLYERAKAKIRLGLAATDIIPMDKPPGVDVIAVNSEDSTAQGFHADRVIFAAPHFLTRYLIRPYRDNPPRHVAEFEYGAWMVANLFLKDRPKERGFPLAWDNVLYDSPSLGYVVATHQRGLDRGPTIFTYYHPLCDYSPIEARRMLLAQGWSECADVAVTDLRRAHPDIDELIEKLDVMRWGHAMIRPRPGFIWGGARIAAIKSYRGIHFAHSDLSGIALFEEAFHHGVRAADEIIADLKS
jgi:protoporphyrinogen oxidase